MEYDQAPSEVWIRRGPGSSAPSPRSCCHVAWAHPGRRHRPVRRIDLSKSLKVAFAVALCLTAPLQPVASAQVSVGENVNVLPVYKSAPPASDDYLRGDLFGQRQNEPSVAVSTVNKDHIVAFYNDFRAVDLGPTEPPLSGTTSSLLARLWNGAKALFARAAGRSERESELGDPDRAASAEAWIGMSVSYDGGLTVGWGPRPRQPRGQLAGLAGVAGLRDAGRERPRRGGCAVRQVLPGLAGLHARRRESSPRVAVHRPQRQRPAPHDSLRGDDGRRGRARTRQTATSSTSPTPPSSSPGAAPAATSPST